MITRPADKSLSLILVILTSLYTVWRKAVSKQTNSIFPPPPAPFITLRPLTISGLKTTTLHTNRLFVLHDSNKKFWVNIVLKKWRLTRGWGKRRNCLKTTIQLNETHEEWMKNQKARRRKRHSWKMIKVGSWGSEREIWGRTEESKENPCIKKDHLGIQQTSDLTAKPDPDTGNIISDVG